MEDLLEFLFGASGRINRAKYWRSVLISIGAGLMTAVIPFTADSIAAPLFIVTVVVVLVTWLLWNASFPTERLRDRDKSAWWLVVFYVLPGVLTQFGHLARTAGTVDFELQIIPAVAAFALSIWGFVEIGCLRGTSRRELLWPRPTCASQAAELKRSPKMKKSPAAKRPPGGCSIQKRCHVLGAPHEGHRSNISRPRQLRPFRTRPHRPAPRCAHRRNRASCARLPWYAAPAEARRRGRWPASDQD